MFTGRFFTNHIEECAVRRWIVLILVIASLFVPTCEQGEVGEFGAEADYLNDCRPYDLILEELLGTLSSEKIEELLSETDELGMTVPVDEELLGEIEGPVNKLRLFNFEAPEEMAELGSKRQRAYDAAVAAADSLFDAADAYTILTAEYEAGTVSRSERQVRVGELLDSYRAARDGLKVAEKLLPELLESVGEKP
jgi:hypothetical protein